MADSTMNRWQQLKAALDIFEKYAPEVVSPFHCEHDKLHVMVMPSEVSEEDEATLRGLGFFPDHEMECYASYRFGSA